MASLLSVYYKMGCASTERGFLIQHSWLCDVGTAMTPFQRDEETKAERYCVQKSAACDFMQLAGRVGLEEWRCQRTSRSFLRSCGILLSENGRWSFALKGGLEIVSSPHGLLTCSVGAITLTRTSPDCYYAEKE